MVTSSRETTRVLYIAGMGRSGSTLMARLLGQLEGFFNVGEAVRYLVHSEMRSRLRSCGCGREVGECPFWGELISSVDLDLQRFGTRFVRLRYLPVLLSPVLPARLERGREELARVIGDLLGEVARRSGARVLVDASKNPANAHLLARTPGIELHVLHLVRDPRAVVSSWSRPKGYLRRHGALRVTGWWLAQNLLSDLLASRSASYRRVRYESAVADVGPLLGEIQPLAGGGAVEPSFLRGDRALLERQHALAGNPDKFEEGWVTLGPRPWSLPGPRYWMVTALTLPVLRRYGYPVRRSIGCETSR